MVCGLDRMHSESTVSMMLVRRLTMIVLLIIAPTITYALGQWIDGDNLIWGLELRPFWIHGLRECPAC